MKNLTDEVFLTKGVLRWPIDLEEEILAKSLTYEVIYMSGAGKPPTFKRGMRAPFLLWGLG